MSDSALLKQSLVQTYPTVSHGRGVFLYDVDGREYLDGCSGAMTASIGHGVAEVADAMRDQARKVAFTYRTQFTSEPAERLARRLVDLAPDDLTSAFFVSSGSEGTEFAIRAVVNHWRQLGRPKKVKVLGRQLSYHGMTMGALSMSGHAARRPDYGALLHAFPVSPPAYAYRYAHHGEKEETYAARSAAEVEAALIAEDPATVAALIVEPIVGAAGGVLVPPRGYLARLREICDRHEVLLVLDEVITGIGRTGEWFASTAEGVVPDLLVLGKGISGGYAPMAAVLLRSHLVEVMRAGNGTSPFGHTFSGNPVGAATSLAVLDVLERDDVLANVRARGVQLGAGLREAARRHRHVADVRGRGLLWGFEFVADPTARTPPPAHLEPAGTFVRLCMAEGLMVYPAGIAPLNNAIIISPPLVISADETEQLLARLERAFDAMGRQIESWVVDRT